jgi:hypothetical protein
MHTGGSGRCDKLTIRSGRDDYHKADQHQCQLVRRHERRGDLTGSTGRKQIDCR